MRNLISVDNIKNIIKEGKKEKKITLIITNTKAKYAKKWR